MLDRARAAGLARILVPGWDLASSEAALALATRHPGLLDAAVGVHPHHAATLDAPGWAHLERLAGESGTRAIGEIGLDHHRNLSPPDVQRDVLERQLALAAAHDLPVLVHDREAHEAIVMALLAASDRTGRTVRGVLHAFSGDRAMAARLVEAGYLISFALPVAFRIAHGPRDAARTLEDSTFVVETDAPYLGPDDDQRALPEHDAGRRPARPRRCRGSTCAGCGLASGDRVAGLRGRALVAADRGDTLSRATQAAAGRAWGRLRR